MEYTNEKVSRIVRNLLRRTDCITKSANKWSLDSEVLEFGKGRQFDTEQEAVQHAIEALAREAQSQAA